MLCKRNANTLWLVFYLYKPMLEEKNNPEDEEGNIDTTITTCPEVTLVYER